MAAKADPRQNLRLTVNHSDAVEGPGDLGSGADPVAGLAQALLESGPATCITDRRGELLHANAAFGRIAQAVAEAGLSPIGRPINPLPAGLGASDAELAKGAAQSPEQGTCTIVINGEACRYRMRREILRGRGEAAQAVIFSPLGGEDGARLKMVAAIERLEDITRLVSDWVWETNRNLVLTFVSPRVNEALGYHQVELTGRKLTDLLSQRSDSVEALANEEERRPFRDLEIRIAHRNGTLRHVLLSGLPIYCPETGSFLGFRGTAHDISELKWREEALLRAKEDAELADRTKSEFLAAMSHELRTPLNAIIGFSDIMGSEMLGPLGSEQYKAYTKDITESAYHLLALINDILDAAKIEAGEVRLDEEAVDPRALLESVQRLVTPRAERANLRLDLDVPGRLPTLNADKTKLKRILINLLSNAVKFTPEGGRVILSAEAAPDGSFVFIVSDTGIGIADQDIARAMAPFGQVDTRLSRKFEGTGLGLPLAKSLTELHGGTFQLVSQPGVGTTVTLRLPTTRVIES